MREKKNSPPNLKKGNIVKALLDVVLHCFKRLCSWYHTVLGLRGTPILLDKIELAVILRINIAQVAAALD